MKGSLKSLYVEKISEYFNIDDTKFIIKNYEKGISTKSKVFKKFGIFDRHGRYQKQIEIKDDTISKNKLLFGYLDPLIKSFYNSSFEFMSLTRISEVNRYNSILNYNIKTLRNGFGIKQKENFEKLFGDNKFESFNDYLLIGYLIYDFVGVIMGYMNIDEITKNKTESENKIYLNNKISVSYKPNEKLLKLIKRLFSETIKNHYVKKEKYKELTQYINFFMDIVSTELSKRIVDGKNKKYTMLISYNPYDILTLSDEKTTTGWRSCLAWYNGEYGSGAIGYGVDKKTFIVKYQNKSDKTELRFLVHYEKEDETFIVQKTYPRHKSELKNVDIEFIKVILNEVYKLNVSEEEIIKDSSYIDIESKYILNKTIKGGYIDVTKYIIKTKKEMKYRKINILDKFHCISCGNNNNAQLYERNCKCYECSGEGYAYCRYCSTKATKYIEGTSYCDKHFEEYIAKCECCGTETRKEKLSLIEDKHICTSCLRNKNYIKCYRCGTITNEIHMHRGYELCKSCYNYYN